MCDTHHKSETHTPKTATSESRAHYYKVGYRPDKGQPNPLHKLTIKGRWLEALGFTTGQKNEVNIEPVQLIIRLTTEGWLTHKSKIPGLIAGVLISKRLQDNHLCL